MKKSTLIVLLAALALGSFVYFYDMRRGAPKERSDDESKPVFSFSAADVTALTLTRADQKIAFENRNGMWQIIQPIETQADQSAVEGITTGLSSARVSRMLPAKPDQLQSYGLATPKVELDFRLKNGAKHTVRLGDKDFSGIQVYGIVDGAQQVSLLPESLLGSTDRPLDELRDRAVLHIAASDVASFDLKNPDGELEASKKSSDWNLLKPRETAAENGEVESLLSAVALAKMTGIASEAPTDLAKYGLAKPIIILRLSPAKGDTVTLLVGKKEGEDYFARDPSRPMIFRINPDLFKKLSAKFFDLRDKSLSHFDSSQLSRIEIRNSNSKETIVCEKGKNGEWVFDEPAALKGKTVNLSKISLPFETARAQDILDSPPTAIVSRLAKPAVAVTLTDSAGKKTEIRFSAVSEGFVYARTSAGPAVYKLDKKILDDLSFKASELVS